MIYANANRKGTDCLYCVDREGNRAFPLSAFFEEQGQKLPCDLLDLIRSYQDIWTDEIALFFGSRPHLAVSLEELELLAPIPHPARNLVCLGKNYAAHAKELTSTAILGTVPQKPIYFTKPDHTVVGPEQDILLHPEATSQVDYEVELAVVIGKEGIDISKENAEDYIFGYTIANDVSARDLQQEHSQWYKGKSLTTHCPMGPWIVHKSTLPLPLELSIQSLINGELRQNANTRDLIFDIPTIISDLSRGYPLHPGDVILTGTPAGVGMGFHPPKYLKPGDEVCCQIEQIGLLRNIAR